MRVILSANAVWAVAKDSDVEENVRMTPMMVRNSRMEIVIYCGGGEEVLCPNCRGGTEGRGPWRDRGQ